MTETPAPYQSSTAEQEQQEPLTASPSSSKAPKEEKISFYLTREQADKLDELAYEHKKRTGQRINRNDVVRHLIDQSTIDSLTNLQP